MRSGTFPWKILVLLILICVVLVNGEKLDFYQDVEPEPPEDIAYERLAHYLELRNQQPLKVNRGELATYSEYLDYWRRKEKERLENQRLLDVLQNQKVKERYQDAHQWPSQYESREDYSRSSSNENEPPTYINRNPAPSRFEDYSNIKIPFAKNIFVNQEPYYNVPSSRYSPRLDSPENENYPIEDIDPELLLKLQGKIMEPNENNPNTKVIEKSLKFSRNEPEFTYKFDPPKINERDTFAIKPNDPRYYENDEHTRSNVPQKETNQDWEKVFKISQEDKESTSVRENNENLKENTENTQTDNIRNKFTIMKVAMTEPHRRSQHDPLVTIVSSDPFMENDIYFIAVVAGCSAAAMFALVLIALTWCRFQRGAKAAADIEYPAYGVTGPNKDISPSGDQRLAHSAQMYHFQHQKQQIIAMENRTAASRDPGSVSEAESDEENEEGDYTVYECPGLASTGEMEVKNPMFQDDPTPATPSQNHKEEEHM